MYCLLQILRFLLVHSFSLGLMFLDEIQFWKCQCAQVLSVAESQLFCLCTHSLHHPWLSTEGSGNRTEGSGLHPLWSEGVRRIGCIVCCAETWGGYVAGLGYYSLAPHSSRASRLPTVQHCISPPCSLCQLSGWMCCAPAEMAS